MNKKALIEVLKSFGRFMWFGILGLVSTFLVSLTTDQNLMNSTVSLGDITLQTGVFLVAAIGFAIKALDRYIHKNKNIELKGLAPEVLQK